MNFERPIQGLQNKEKELLTSQEAKENSFAKSQEIFNKEILPILEILKPDEMSIEEYRDQIMDDLSEEVKKIQVSQGRLFENPQKEMEEINNLLNSKIREVVKDGADYRTNKKVDPLLLKKSKIALIFKGDDFDLKRYFGKYYKNENILSLKEYIVGNDNSNKFSESDIEALMKTNFRKNLIDSEHYYYFSNDWGTCKEIPKSLLLAFAESKEDRNKWIQIKGALENAEYGKYDKEAFEKLINNDYGRYAIENINKFTNIDLSCIYNSDKLIKYEKIESTLDRIKDSALSEKEKSEVLKECFKNYLSKGELYNFCDTWRKVGLTEDDIKSKDIRDKALEGFAKFLPQSENHYSTVERYISFFNITDEECQTPENKVSAIKCLEGILSNWGRSSSVMEYIVEVIKKFGISDDEYKQALYNTIIKLSNLENRSFLRFFAEFNVPREAVESENIKNKLKESFVENIDDLNVENIKNILNNFPFLKEMFPKEYSPRDIIFENLKIKAQKNENGKIKSESLNNIQESFWVKENINRLPEQIKKILDKFQNQYGYKGENLIALAISAYGTEYPDKFVEKMNSIEKVLNKYNSDAIPEEAKVSMGIEYEVTHSIASAYSEGSYLGYKKDIQLVSESANIGHGNDSIHEIATKPNYNPYMLMAEVKLLQDAGFIDFNFERYNQAPRGYHLSLVGDSGLKLNSDLYFLNNAMAIAQVSGITSGKEINTTKSIHSKKFENFSDYKQLGSRCEIKGMATDSVEQFEKAIITAHHAGIAIQVCKKYFKNIDSFAASEVEVNFKELESELLNKGFLIKPFETDQERDIAYVWTKFKRDLNNAIDQHNEQFINSEFNGFILDKDGVYVDTGEHIDINRNKKLILKEVLDSEKFKEKIHLNKEDLYNDQRPRFINALINTNNIFLKSPQGNDNSSINAKAVLSTFKGENYSGIMDGNSSESIFDNNGEFRDGYYYTQGASEEMIIHKSQILLNNFNKNMDKLLQSRGVKRVVGEKELEYA